MSFLFPKGGVIRRLRRRAGRRVGSSEDVELALGDGVVGGGDNAGASGSGGSGDSNAGGVGGSRSSIAPFLVEPRNRSGEQVAIGFERGSAGTQLTTASVSDPILGPHSNPENYRFQTAFPGTSKSGAGASSAAAPEPPKDSLAEGGGDGDTGVGDVAARRISRRWSAGDGPLPSEYSPPPDAADAPADGNEAVADGNIAGTEEELLVESGDQEENGLEYMHVYLDSMYYFGTSPYRTPKTRAAAGHDLCSRILHWMQLTCFSLTVIWALWDSFSEAKYNFLLFMAGQGLSYFVVYSFYMFCFLTKAYGVYRLTFKWEDTDKMLAEIQVYGQEYGPPSAKLCKYWRHVIRAISLSTLILCVGNALFDGGFEEWTPEAVVNEKAYKFSLNLFLWRYTDIQKASAALAKKYGDGVTGTTITYAIASMALNYASNFFLGSIRILVLFVVFVGFLFVLGLIKGMSETMENAPKDDQAACQLIQQRRERVWKQYRKIRLVFAAANKVFDSLLQLLHVDNLLLYGFFATLCIERDDTPVVQYGLYLYKIVKSELTYFLAKKITKQNDYIRKWIRNWARHTGKIVVDGEEYDVDLLLDELDREPLGLGTGNFVMHQEFHFKFLGLVGSLVLFLAEEKRKQPKINIDI